MGYTAIKTSMVKSRVASREHSRSRRKAGFGGVPQATGFVHAAKFPPQRSMDCSSRGMAPFVAPMLSAELDELIRLGDKAFPDYHLMPRSKVGRPNDFTH